MEKINLNYTDFWPAFDKFNNYFTNILQKKYVIEITDQPDFLFYSVFGQDHKNYSCIKIFYTGENIRPNFSECDFAFTFDYLEQKNHYRLPLYAINLQPNIDLLIKKELNPRLILQEKTKFCNFVYTSSWPQKRTEFFYKLSKYKQVDSAGLHLNNIGGTIGSTFDDKLKFIKDYKFTIAFENSSYPGYTTEKIIHAMMVNSIPIYWGNELIQRDFNPKSFLNYYDYPNEDALIKRIIEVDQNDDLFMQYLREPYFYNNCDNEFINEKNILNQFQSIFKQ